MSNANTEKKSEFSTDDLNFNSIGSVVDLILSAFKLQKPPIEQLPPPLLLTGGLLRPGVTATEVAARIISRQSESGAVVGDVFADGDNIAEAMELIRIQEIIDALLTESKIEIIIPPGVQVVTVGVSPLGPVTSFGMTTSPASGWGIIR
jgi:urease gamma subunit